MSTVVAGRELDALIAEKVMGWTYKTFPDGVLPHVKHWHGPNDECLLPCYSISIAAAWQVVGLLSKEWKFDLEYYPGLNNEPDWCAMFFNNRDSFGNVGAFAASADTAPLAICLAALRAIESK
jgi:hypothetical protein